MAKSSCAPDVLYSKWLCFVEFYKENRFAIKLVDIRDLLKQSTTLKTFEEVTSWNTLPFDTNLITQNVVTNRYLHWQHPKTLLIEINWKSTTKLSRINYDQLFINTIIKYSIFSEQIYILIKINIILTVIRVAVRYLLILA